MNPFSTGWNRNALRFTLAAACGLLTVAATTPARSECSPQEVANIIASDAAASEFFGISVAVSGDTAVVGANFDDQVGEANAGSAYVFTRVGGVWTEQQKLNASDAAAQDQFGGSVALSGDTAVVAALGDDDAGSAYVFIRLGGVWTEQQKLTAADAAADDVFGYSVAVSGDTAVVGAIGDDHAGGVSAGSAYVFTRCGGVWTQQQKLTAADAAASDLFGNSVAVFGDTAVVGALQDDHAGGDGAGSAYVFTRSGGVWTQQQKLTAADAAAGDLFGRSVAVSGDTAVLGALGDDHAGGADAGSAYVFTRVGGVWTEQQKLTASDAEANDRFGFSVAVSGNSAIVGAYTDDHPGGTDAGSAYAFARDGTVWTQQARLSATDAAASDWFGISVAISGDTLVVGASLDDHAGGFDAGSAYAYDLGCDDDGDGVLNVNDVCPNTSPGLAVDCAGRPLHDCNSDCLYNADDIQCLVDEMLNQ